MINKLKFLYTDEWFLGILAEHGDPHLGRTHPRTTASKYVADRAPADLRGRYMSLYWLGWGLALTLSPIIGGFLNDNIAPRAIWVGGLLLGLTSAFGLFFSIALLYRRQRVSPNLNCLDH
jgi:MFS family permease